MDLKSWRRSLKLKQAEAASLLDLSQPVYSRYETRTRIPRPATMRIIKDRTGGLVAEADWYADPDPQPASRADNVPACRADNTAAHHLAAPSCEAAHG